LDANYRVGSGGYNAPVTQQRIDSQLYVTGQVSGLSSFRGRVGYAAENELRLDLPSAGLSDFRRQSVGLPDVTGGNPLVPAPYFERTRTILDADRLRTGQAIPGSNAPSQLMLQPSAQRRLYEQATTGYEPLLEAAAPGRLLAVPGAGQWVPDGGTGAEPLGADTVFGIARREDRQRLVQELLEMRQDRRIDESAEQGQEGEGDERIRSEIDARITEIKPVPLPPQAAGQPDEPAPGTAEQGLPGLGEPFEQAEEPPPAQDVYLELLYGLRRQRRGADRQADTVAEEGPAGPPDGQAPAILTEPLPPRPRRGGAVELLPGGGVVLHGLAGGSPDRFNRYMTAGQEKLKAGRYYQAAEQYELAMTLDAANPLARVGMGLALFAAGEPLSAAMNLRRALQLLPPMMEIRLDLPALLDAEVIERRTAELDARLAEPKPRDELLLRFLATVIHRDLGHQDKAREHAERLRDIAGGDKLMAAFAQFILTGKRPGEQTPAEAPDGQ